MDYQPKGTNLDEEIKKKNETDWLAIQQAKNLYLQAQQAGDSAAMKMALEKNLPGPKRGCGGFSREELAVLYAAMLTEGA
jgi:hypothetical protein